MMNILMGLCPPKGYLEGSGELVALVERLCWKGSSDDLDEIIRLYARETSQHDRDARRFYSVVQGLALIKRFYSSGEIADIDTAITILQEAVRTVEMAHSKRHDILKHLTTATLIRFEQTGRDGDFKDCVALNEEVLRVLPDIHPGRSSSLNNLANALSARFSQRGKDADLETAISLHREALALCPASHPDRSTSLNDLAAALWKRFEQRWHAADLEEAISLHREALTLRSAPHLDRARSLNNLAGAVWMRFDQKGKVDDLEESILLHREALALFPIRHPNRSGSLNNLAGALVTRFEQQWQMNDLEEAISCYGEALKLLSASHPDRSGSLNNLASALSFRFKHGGQSVDLDEAIILHREALTLRPVPHLDRSASLNNLAAVLSTRFEQKGQMEDLEETISLHQDALILCPAPHPDRSVSLNNLADSLSTLFEKSGLVDDLEEAISLRREALVCLPPLHPHECRYTERLASSFCDRFGSRDMSLLETPMDMFRHAANCTTGSILDRLMAAQTWARYVDDAHHPSALEAYQSAIQLLHLVVMLASDANSRYRLLADRRLRSGVLSSDAAACAIRFDQVECAVEMLEEGRSIFWSQALQLRTSLDDLHHAFPEFAKRLKKIFTDLERSSFREGSFASLATRTDVKAVMTMEAEAAQYRRLNEDRLATLQEVRALKGFEGFLHWKRLATLKMAAVHGPVILLNATLSSCDALIVTSTSVERVPLSLQLSDQQVILLANSLLTAVSSFSSFTNKYKGSFETLLEHTQTSRGFLHDRKAGHHQKVSLQNVDDILRGVLAVLWNLVVCPVAWILVEDPVTCQSLRVVSGPCLRSLNCQIRAAPTKAVRLVCLAIPQHVSVTPISQHVGQHPPLGLRGSSGGQPGQVCVVQCTYHVSGGRLEQN